MITMWVLAVFVAGAVVAVCAKPERKGAAICHLLAGALEYRGNESTPAVTLHVADDGCCVTLVRHGLTDMTDDGAVSLAVTVAGFDVILRERTMMPRRPGNPVDTASFNLDFLGRERYHFSYRIGDEIVAAAFSLTLRPGIVYASEINP